MTISPTPVPNEQGEPEQARPDLHVVRETDPSAEVVAPPETTAEITGPIPITDADGAAVAPQAPLDVRIRDQLLTGVRAVPAFGRVSASLADSLQYSQQGDWATSDNGVKRAVHGLATLIAFTVTYPFVEGLGKAREKPIGLVIVLAVLFTLTQFLT